MWMENRTGPTMVSRGHHGAQNEEALRASTARLKVAEAVHVERERFHDVLDMLPAYLVLLSPDYHVPFANRFFEERFGKSNGKRCYEYLFKRTEPCENCETYKVLKTGHRTIGNGPVRTAAITTSTISRSPTWTVRH